MKISGVSGTLDLSVDKIKEQIRLSDIDAGDYLRFYEMGHGRNHDSFLGGTNLEGRMFEFENLFWVAWSCGEYIDTAIFLKENKEVDND